MKELYEFLAKNGVSPNGLYVLHAVYYEYQYQNFVNFKTEQYRLHITGFLDAHQVADITIYKITDKGLHIIKQADDLLSKLKKEKKTKVPFADWEEKIEEYNNMFPKGRKTGSTISFRANPKELYERFVWFFNEYPDYTWEDVFTATKKYLSSFEASMDYTYAQTSKYFVKKEDKNKNTTSTLATMCYNIAQGNDDEVDSGFHYFGA